MQKNMGKTDRSVRILFALIVAILYFTNVITGTLALILGIVSVILLATAAIGFCPMYIPFRISTEKKSAS